MDADYEKMAVDLFDSLIGYQKEGRAFHQKVSEIAKGEMALLLYLAEVHDGAGPLEISAYFEINTSRVAALIRTLSSKGYIERRDNARDKRRADVCITPAGRRFAAAKKQLLLAELRRILEYLGPEDAAEYIRILYRLAGLFAEDAGRLTV